MKLVQQNVRDEDDLHEAMTRQSGSPEPPADPDVWSKPSPPLPSSSKFGATKKGVGAAGPRPREISKSTSSMSTNPADVKPANPTQGILPQNSAGDSFDASAYDAVSYYVFQKQKSEIFSVHCSSGAWYNGYKYGKYNVFR